MQLPCLAFCPYLPMNEPIEFGDWELGPLAAFEERWADLKFKKQAKASLAKFVDGFGQPIKRPSLLCRRHGLIDGTLRGSPFFGHKIPDLKVDRCRCGNPF